MTDVSPFAAGLRCRCPRCGRGALYRGYLDIVDRCAVCGLELAGKDSGDGPAVFLIWGTVILGVTLGLLRPAKALVMALQYRYRRAEFDGPAP